ncbi:hypothetical protein PEp14_00042 [Erwinia phage PEp14]|uniref:Uncharacterized protein n=1 Tax=Erwinia phage PEp14 TaxID=1131315 RepID=H2DE72_9CAUD|nr:hypothetical protein PEp14_00042 [Erwinia phage PEp14]AEY69631.1 hypothetical protein PEp14_00042 [Erwinia phage PEp14]
MTTSNPRFVGLKTGDKVLVEMEIDGGWRFTRRITVEQTVTRMMKTQFTTSRGQRFMIESGREVGGRQYGGAYAYPVGFMVGQGWGKDPVPMAITPPEEVREWKERCAVAAGFDTLISKLSRQSSRRLQLVQQDPELVAQLRDVLPILQNVLAKTGD